MVTGVSAVQPKGNSVRILVVEDADRVASFIVKGLREEGFAVDRAATGPEALDAISLNDYDLVILDVMLPGADGFKVTERLRGSGNEVPIIMLTARDGVADRVRGLDVGADDYLTKPFAFEELVARVRANLRRGPIQVDPILELDDLRLDPATREVSRGGQRIELTVKEYGLLDYLLRNKNRIVTRTSIIEHVWDVRFDSDTNLVDVYVRYLRKKIDEPFERKLIHTVRGVGYVMREPDA